MLEKWKKTKVPRSQNLYESLMEFQIPDFGSQLVLGAVAIWEKNQQVEELHL